MITISTWNSSGKELESIEVNEDLFGVPMNEALVHQVAVSHMANARQGTASTKTRGMVSGGGAKPWAQKHTGRARQGSSRAPHWRGGGVVFGPHPRDFSQKIPKKMNKGALRCILSQKVRDNKIVIIDAIQVESSKTKEMHQVLSNLKIKTPTLIVTGQSQSDIIKSSRNIKRVRTLPAKQLNALDLLNHDKLLITIDAIRVAEQLWSDVSNINTDVKE
jgi:large subunit ribosomal protein L4